MYDLDLMEEILLIIIEMEEILLIIIEMEEILLIIIEMEEILALNSNGWSWFFSWKHFI